MTTKAEFKRNQQYEAAWWGDCTNTFGEETKQLTYSHRMGIENHPADGRWPSFDLAGRSVLDIGGGPTSMLLRSRNGGRMLVVDPCQYPDWVAARYAAKGIEQQVIPAEEFKPPAARDRFDECWIYNVLQHVLDPQAVINIAKRSANLIRIIEWINIPPHEGHPHELKAPLLADWLGGPGSVEDMGAPPHNGQNGCNAQAFYGAFPVARTR